MDKASIRYPCPSCFFKTTENPEEPISESGSANSSSVIASI